MELQTACESPAFAMNLHDLVWAQTLELLDQFHKETGRWPSRDEMYGGRKLGQWCIYQRKLYKQKILLDSRLDALKKIGFPICQTRQELAWEAKLELLKEFRKKYKRWPKQTEIYRGENLGLWCSAQKNRVAARAYSNDRLEKLKEIGFPLHSREESWDCMFDLLSEFYKKYQRPPKNKETYKGKNLGAWYFSQRRKGKEGKLSQERRTRFATIGIDLSAPIRISAWEERFALLKQFYEEFGRFPYSQEIYNGIKLGNWLCLQKSYARLSSSYPEERRRKLIELGVVIDKKEGG